MNKTIKFLVYISLTIFFFVFVIQLFTSRVILNHHIFDNLRSMTFKLNNDFPEENKDNKYIDNVNYELIDDDLYLISIIFKDKNLSIEKINVNFKEYSLNKNDNYDFNLSTSFKGSQLKKEFNIQNLILENGETINLAYTFSIYKDVSNSIINEKKQSIVGISTKNSWGSGIILSKDEFSMTNILGKEKKLYEYLILTAEHVIKNNTKVSIHYLNTYNTYGHVKVLKTFSVNNDLALLKLTTTDNSLIPLNDSQFINNKAISYQKGEIVFTIGSPMNKTINFNTISIGTITNTKYSIDLCGNDCKSIQYTNALGSGSSGGALFNQSGNLIGLHFAGDNDNKFGYSIPIETILNVTKDYYLYKNKTPQLQRRFLLF